MKMNKKKVFTLALAVCMIAILSMGSLAWFSDSESIKNDFMIAGSDGTDPDAVFSVDVWENRDTNGDGDYNEPGDVEKDTDGLVYESILPGDNLSKEVFVENTGSYDQYIRVTVVISDAGIWQQCLGDEFNDSTLLSLFGGFEQSEWSNITTAVVNDTIKIVMYYNHILGVDGTVNVFDTVSIPTQLTREQATRLGANGFSIDVTADAVQTENLGVNTTDDVCDAYEAFQVVMP